MPKLRSLDSEKTRDEIEQSLRNAISRIDIGEDGEITLQGSNIFAFDVQVFGLVVLVQDLLPPMTQSQASALVKQAVFRAAKRAPEDQTLDTFFDDLDRYLDHEGEQNVRVIQFLNVSPSHSVDSFTVTGTTLTKLAAIEAFPAQFNQTAERLNTAALRNLAKFSAYQYDLEIPSYQTTLGVTHSVEKLTRPFEQMRALLGFADQSQKITFGYSVAPEPLAKYLPSPFTLVSEQDAPGPRLLYFPTRVNYRFQNPDQMVWDQAAGLETRIYGDTRIRRQMIDFVDMLLRLYQQALDATDAAISFLHFWQILERIASPTQIGRGIETKAILTRLDTITKLDASERRVLHQLGEFRHEYVHGGLFPFGEGEQVNRMLKSYVDDNLSRLINTLDVFQTLDDLEQYYVVAVNPNESRLAALEKAIRFQRSKAERAKSKKIKTSTGDKDESVTDAGLV